MSHKHHNESQPLFYRFSWLHLMRPPTWSGTISPVLAAAAFAAKKASMRPGALLTMLIASVLIQSAVNMLNDYFDRLRGQDGDKWTDTPGHGPAHRLIPAAAGVMLVAAGALGGYLAWQSHIAVAWVGVVAIACGIAYSAGPRPLAALGLGELTAAICMGPVITMLAYAVHGHAPDAAVFALSIPFAFLIASMILTNNIRDIEKDRPFRRTLAMRLGRRNAVRLLVLLLVSAYLSIAALIVWHVVPLFAAMTGLALPLAIRLCLCFRPGASQAEQANGMKWAARHHWAAGLLLALSLWLSL
ncbi:1,4-dihydroxy-2-naphthoate prenyltransferase [Geobacillus genomosp. 3]|uniref:1,4-dihydroxy-2-naphthoate prenyltransferase n=1 Tax=Geobacillus genomosp. 3 TaxID=1921421 RepID=S5Z418_GEOG3|nr:prenyltransferase [Geobacillus genomosp. 3]AGT33784.1 1,4-dihydroxy-2-naphthoate prenyltransferase [Geobacillus genomosp. 3]